MVLRGRRRAGLRLGHGRGLGGPLARPARRRRAWCPSPRLQRHHGAARRAGRHRRRRVRRVDPTDQAAVREALDGAAMLWLESPTNPMLEVVGPASPGGDGPRGRRGDGVRQHLRHPARPAPARGRRRRRAALGHQVPLRPLRRHPRRPASPRRPPRPARELRARRPPPGSWAARSPDRWRPGWRCAACAPCTCGSSGPPPTPASSPSRLEGAPGGDADARYPGFGAIIAIEVPRRRRGGRTRRRGDDLVDRTPPASAGWSRRSSVAAGTRRSR